jgi:hypothetical protein
MLSKLTYSSGEFLDFRMTFKISAFLFAGLIFFVTFLHQGKKVKALYFKGNLKPKYLIFILLKSKTMLII